MRNLLLVGGCVAMIHALHEAGRPRRNAIAAAGYRRDRLHSVDWYLWEYELRSGTDVDTPL